MKIFKKILKFITTFLLFLGSRSNQPANAPTDDAED